MPEILVAGGDSLGACGTVVEGEVECGSAVATLRIESKELRIES